MRTDPTAVPVPSSTPPRAPQAVLEADAVVVGGGPVGATLAALLHLRGLRPTVIERRADVNAIDVPRSYTLGLNSHGLPALQSVPGLFESLVDHTVETRSFSNAVLTPDGSLKRMGFPIDNPVAMRFVLRTDLTTDLHKYLRECKGVTLLYGASVDGLEAAKDGTVTLSLNYDKSVRDDSRSLADDPAAGDRPETLRSKLVFACDGANSAVLRALRAASLAGAPLQSSNGLDDWVRQSPASKVEVKSMRIDASISKLFDQAGGDKPVNPSSVLVLAGRGTGVDKSLLVCWPLTSRGVSTVGGRIASFAGPPERTLLKLRDVDAAFKFLEDCFPQVPIRDIVSEKSLREFVEARSTPLGPIRRCNSLVAHVGDDGQGGVVLMGDAAHSFPPDLGQGVNCGLEDVCAFANVLDAAACGSDDEKTEVALREMLVRYEQDRTPAVDGIVYAMRHGFPWQYGQSRFRSAVWFAKTTVLEAIATALPAVFDPPVCTMARNGVSYAEVKRRSEVSFRRLCVAAAGLAAGVALVVASRRVKAPVQ